MGGVPQSMEPPFAAWYAARAAAMAAESAAVCAASRRKWAHPTTTSSPMMPSSGTNARVNRITVWPRRGVDFALIGTLSKDDSLGGRGGEPDGAEVLCAGLSLIHISE